MNIRKLHIGFSFCNQIVISSHQKHIERPRIVANPQIMITACCETLSLMPISCVNFTASIYKHRVSNILGPRETLQRPTSAAWFILTLPQSTQREHSSWCVYPKQEVLVIWAQLLAIHQSFKDDGNMELKTLGMPKSWLRHLVPRHEYTGFVPKSFDWIWYSPQYSSLSHSNLTLQTPSKCYSF